MSAYTLKRTKAGLGILLGLLMVISGINLPVVQPSQDLAVAADMNQFDAGRIIDDAVFFNGNALNAQQVQAFLNSRVPQCTINNGQPSRAAGAPFGSTTIANNCLKDYRQATPTMAAQPGLCAQYPGSGSESAAEIIAKVGQVCNISQKVLLVLLEKEQSLVTDTWPTVRQFTAATGFACYDNGQPCVADYNGFFYQVWSAARQFQRYGTGSFTWYPVGRVSNILYQANRPSCGSKPVLIQNRATAALYYYTPYTPNWSALFGSGDECSAYGNRNFYRFFVNWFGSVRSELPQGVVDSAGLSVVNGQPTISVSGWAFDPADSSLSSPVHIHVVTPSGQRIIAGATADLPRDDVNAALRITGRHGYSASVPVTGPGTYNVCVFGIGATSFSAGNRLLGCRNVNFTQRPLEGVVDSAGLSVVNGQPTISVSGWAFDPADSSLSSPVHIHVVTPSGQRIIAGATADLPRDDVNAALRITGRHGYSASVPVTGPGTYNVCVFGIGATSFSAGNRLLGCRNVNFTQRPLEGVVDSAGLSVVNGQPTISVSGWAFDPADSSLSSPVHIHVVTPSGQRIIAGATADLPRDDVNAALRITGRHGYSASVPVTGPGTYNVCVFGIGATSFSAGNRLLRCTNVIF